MTIATKARHIHKTLLENFDFCSMYAFLRNYWSPAPPSGHDGVVRGVTKQATDPSRAVGASVHHGINMLAMGASVDAAADAARAEYVKETRGGFSQDIPLSSKAQASLFNEHNLIIEATVNVWAAVALPIITSRYRVVEAEQSVFVELTPQLTVIVRPDIVLQDPVDGRYVNYSLKTEKSHSYIKHPNAMIDIGGSLELMALAAKFGGPEKMAGTWMNYLVVGADKVDSDGETFVRWMPSMRGWESRGADGLGEQRYAWSYEYDNPDYDPNGPKDSTKNPKSKRLPAKDKWSRMTASEYAQGGLKGWIRDLLAKKFMPVGLDPRQDLILMPDVYTRSEGEIERFTNEVVAQQEQVSSNLAALAAGTIPLEVAFPKRRSSCMRYGRCEMWDICWKGAGADPWAVGYSPRKSSIDKAKEKGLVVEGQ